MAAYLSQIAFSVTNLDRSIKFYRDVLGLTDSGGVTSFRGPTTEYIQGINGVASKTHWLQDERSQFQLEFFEFEYPPVYPIPQSRRACDIGLTRVAFDVADIEKVISSAVKRGAIDVQGPSMIDGKKHAVLKDPDGILIELIESPEKLGGNQIARAAGIALSINKIDHYTKLYTEGFSLPKSSNTGSQIDSLLGMTGASRKVIFVDGGTVWIEISEYTSPVPTQLRKGYLLTDIGISHIAFSAPSYDEFMGMYNKLVGEEWLIPNSPKPFTIGKTTVLMYCKDSMGLTVEAFYVSSRFHGIWGFRPPSKVDKLWQNITNFMSGLLYQKKKK